MRLAKGKKITSKDRREIAQFNAFLGEVASGKPQQRAYAERYGEVVFEAKPFCLACREIQKHPGSGVGFQGHSGPCAGDGE